MATMVKLQTVTVGSGGAATIDFTSIPQTYTDLKIVLSARTDRASASQDGLLVKLNGSTTGFTYRNLIGDGSAASSSNGSTATALRATASTATASVFSNGEFYLPNYTSSNNKSYSSDNVIENNATAATQNLYAGLWSNTSAVTSISITSENSANFVQYTTATLYGVKALTTATGTGKAKGGDQVYTDGTYWYHVYRTVGTSSFTPLTSLSCDYLVVGGGGAGGGAKGGSATTGAGGGGGGGYKTAAGTSFSATAYTVTVGAGGTGVANSTGNSGSSSSITGIATATGGAGGGTSGGTSGDGPSNAGGTNEQNSVWGAGGGGGGSAVGSNGTTSAGGNGGNGYTSSYSGTSTVYAGGGGGGVYLTTSQSAGSGGTGGGGAGRSGNGNGTAATANTGGGGGGAGAQGAAGTTSYSGGDGGSGIVIVRYAV